MRRLVPAALAAALCLAAVAGCTAGDGPQDEAPVELDWPLTGLPGYSPADSAQAITVKVENTESGRPQAGIGSADVVVQEMVEGGLTRLAVIFHSDLSAVTGPVRSMRETDIGIVLPTAGTLAASGGSSGTVAAIEASGVTTAVEGEPGFFRDGERRAPYDLMVDLAALSASLPPGPPLEPYLTFGEVPAAAEGVPAASLELRWPSAASAFAYDAAAERWRRSDLPGAEDFAFTNVVALMVPVSFSDATDAAGTRVPTMGLTGTGQGYVATGPTVYRIGWSKASDAAPWRFTHGPADAQGASQDFPLPAGRTWVALLPVDTGQVAFGAAGS